MDITERPSEQSAKDMKIMGKTAKFVDEVKKVFNQLPLVGKTLEDIYFFDDDPFLNKDHMTSIFNNVMHYGAIVAKTIRKSDIPDNVEITRGRGNCKNRFMLVFSDKSALEFLLNSKNSEIRPIPPEKVFLPERKINIDEHRLFEPVFGRTISEHNVWFTNGNYTGIIIEISFREGLILRLSDHGIYIMQAPNHPMTINIGRYRKMIRGYPKLFDEKLELYQNVTSSEELEAEGISEEQIVGYKLEQYFFEKTGDVKFVYDFMSHLKTHEERLEMLKITEQQPELSLMELALTVRHIADQRNKQSNDT